MADVKIDLEIAHKEFVSSLAGLTKSIESVLSASQKLITTQDKVKSSADHAAQAKTRTAEATNRYTQSIKSLDGGLKTLGSTLGRTVVLYNALYDAGKKAFSFLGDIIKATITNIDDFQKASIGTAAAITNIADTSAAAGRTYSDIFLQNLRATKSVFIDLEKLAAKYFASSVDLQLAYNTFAQRGVVIRRTELEQLAQLTDLILLLTGGQQSTIQIQEEIRSLMNGTLRATSQLSQLLNAFGADVDAVGRKIRATQSLDPLSGILVGARAATGEIQKTFQATVNGIETVLRQLGRIAGQGFFNALTSSVERFTNFVKSNQDAIGSFFSLIGKLLGDIVVRAERFAEAFLNKRDISASISSFAGLAAAIETVGSVLFRVAEIILILLRNLPRAVSEFTSALEFANLDPIKRNLKLQERELKATMESLIAIAQNKGISETTRKSAEAGINDLQKSLSIIEEQLDEKPFFDKALDKAKAFIAKVIPGMKETQGVVGGVAKAVEALTAGIDKLPELDVKKLFGQNKAGILGAVREFQNNLKISQGPATDITAQTVITQKRDAGEISAKERATRQLIEATIQLEKAERNRDQQAAAAAIDIDLQRLRRELALIEQGFVLADGKFQEFRTSAAEVTKFVTSNIRSIVQGQVTDVSGLVDAVQSVVGKQGEAVFTNLREQLERTRKGFEEFRDVMAKDQSELLFAQAEPFFAASRKTLEDAKKEFEDTVSVLTKKVTEAQGALNGATAKDRQQKQLDLQQAEQFRVSGEAAAQLELQAKELTAESQRQQGIREAGIVLAQTQLRISTEQAKIVQEQLRIEQQLNAERGKGQQGLNAGRVLQEGLSRRIQERSPRTELEGELSRIEDVRVQAAERFAQVGAAIQAMTSQADALALAGDASAIKLYEEVAAMRVKLLLDEQVTAKLLEQARSLEHLKVALDAMGNAGQSAARSVVDGMLAGFEGKKTNFTQVFKGISDQLVRDSLKNTFDAFGKAVSSGFQSVVGKLGDLLPKELGDKLGPAFSAGIGLIASFVLGQLLGDNGGSASAGNPTIGIQSTEQVRGLIGGDTQIPIGQIGESLQDALVPTNLLLARIARAVESQIGGLGPDQVEEIIGRAVGDALQIQPV